MALTRDQAAVIMDLIEAATDGNWPNTRSTITDIWAAEDVVDATAELAELAERSPPLVLSDFEE